MKLFELIEAKKKAKTEEERREFDRLIEERIRWIGSAGQGDGP